MKLPAALLSLAAHPQGPDAERLADNRDRRALLPDAL
jgi:hypothetical protein